jgi:hypothetical protein
MLGIASLVFSTFGLIAISAPAMAAQQWVVQPAVNGVVCQLLTGGTIYPADNKLYYCDDPSRRAMGDQIFTKVSQEPSNVRKPLDGANVQIFVWTNWEQYKQYTQLPFPPNLNESITIGFTRILATTRQIHLIRFFFFPPSVNLDVGPTYVLGAAMHEIGHQLDGLWIPPNGNLYNSQQNSGGFYYQMLVKDKQKLNSYPPCGGLFNFEKDSNGPLCVNGQLQAPYNNTTLYPTNWDILVKLYPYYFIPKTDSGGIVYWGELWAESYSVVTSAGQVNNNKGQNLDTYLFGDAFACSRNYITLYRSTGAAVLDKTKYQSWCR